MSYHFRGGGDRNPKHRDGSLQKKRENEKIRRQQQLHTEEAAVEPVFSQPRKITPTERQDSLTRNIANVLGDSTVVRDILLQEPIYWLGTSRTEQGQTGSGQKDKDNTKPVMQPSNSNKVFTGTSDQSHYSNYKTQSHSEGLQKSDHREGDHRKHISRNKHSRPVNSNHPSSRSSATHSSRTGTEQSGIRHPRQVLIKKDAAFPSTTAANSDRDRISSTDSDMLENILKEMVQLPTHITDIKTPNVTEKKFPFPPGQPKTKTESTESNKSSAPIDEEGSSDTGSSDSSDDEKKNEENPWSLTNLFHQCGDRSKDRPSASEARTIAMPKDKSGKRKMIDPSREHSPKIPNVQSKEDKGYSPTRIHKRPTSSRSSDSPRSKHPASGESKQQNPRKTPSYDIYPKAPPQAKSKDNSKPLGRNTDANKTPALEGGGRHWQRSVSSERMLTDSANSSNSSGSSSSESSEESDSHDEGHPSVHVSKRSRGGDTTLSIPRDTDSLVKKRPMQEMEKPVSKYKPDLNPFRDKYPDPPHRHPRPHVDITVKPEKDGMNAKSKSYPSLWVKIRSTAIGSGVIKVPFDDSSMSPLNNKHLSTKDRPLVSVGSETDQPIRRTKEVEVRDALPSDYGAINRTVTEPKATPDKNPHWKQKQPAPDLPDSSLPGEQERIETSDWYMREGKRMKHEGDSMVDSRNGRTRLGEALTRALSYFEASLFFIMSGYVMENESPEDRMETSSQQSHCPANMYQQTLPLLDFVLKMRSRAEQEDNTFKQITISCLRCQSFLYFRIFHLKNDTAVKNSEILTKHFESISKSAQTHSPWRNGNAAPNVLSPMSPAVPSPFTHRGPSPASSNNSEQVSSSTQVGKMTPTSHSSLPQKTYDLYRQQHAIMCNLLQAHEKWDLAESMIKDHADFFRAIDALSNITLTFHSSLRHVFLYYKMVLHQLRDFMTRSPSP